MLEEFFKIWNKDGLVKQANEETLKMVYLTKNMYIDSMKALKTDVKTCPVDLYKNDKEVNRLQIDVRRKILEHLSLSPRRDVTASLVLLLSVNDIERVGDYCKNVCDLASIHPEALKKNAYLEIVDEIDSLLSNSFDLLEDSFKDGSVEKAMKVARNFDRVKRLSEKIIEMILKDQTLSRKELVIYSLLSRHLKRIGAHQKNAATTVINPFERIGYQNMKSGAGKT